MNRRFFKRAVAFMVASLMAVGVITILPDEYFPQIGTNISAEGTYSTKIKIKRIEIVNSDIAVTVNSITDTNNNFINDGEFNLSFSVDDYNNLLPDNPLGVIHTYGCNYDADGNAGEWGFSGNSNTTFTSSIISLYAAVHSYDEYCIDLGYADRNVDDYESTFVSCIKVYFDPKHTYIEDFTSDETGHWYACNGCDEKIDFAAHTEDSGTVTVEPTETTEGEKVYKCTACDYATRTEPIEKLELTDGVAINEANFPDEVFKQYVSDNFDSDNNGFLSNEEIGRVTEIILSNSGIQNLKGVEYFTALTSLICDGNQLTSLDVSNNTALTHLYCYDNQLTSFNVSNNTELIALRCWDNQLTSLDVTKNTALTDLECRDNQLTSLDVSKNTALTDLRCDENKLTSLDVSTNTLLEVLHCSGNQLTSLDVSNNTALTWLYCYDNQLTSLDVSNNTALTYALWCFNNQLTSLDVGNNIVLTGLDCSNNQLTSLDVSNNTALTELSCSQNQLTSLDVSNDTALTILWCSKNQLTSLDISTNTALTDLRCDENKLTSLDVSTNTALTWLYCYDNQLTSLDVSNNTALTNLSFRNNQLTSLDVSNNPLLTEFGCNNNFHNIGETCGVYELKNLPAGFDITKALNWQGAVLKDDKLTEIDGTGTITYDYDCGNNHTATFSLIYDYAEHSYDDGVITTEPTEDTEGEKTYTCTQCGATKTDVIEKLEHVHNQGAELMSDETGHWYTCSGCTEKLDFATHTEDSGTVTVEPTEATEGQKVYTCTVCGYTTRTDVVAKLEHVHNQEATLMSDATGHWYACSDCDEKLDFATHIEDTGTVTVEPTENTEGQKVYKCTVCGYTTRTETVAKLEHVHNKGTELVSDGTGHWYTCGGCDEKLDFSTHTEDNGTVTLAPTVTTEGQRVYKCTVCGYTTRTETIAKLENGNTNPSKPSQPTTPTTPTNPTNPTNPTTPQQPATNESDTIISAKNGWGNVVKQINAANENSKITVDMGNTTNVPKNVMNAIKGKNIDIVLDMGDGITWTINGKDVTNPQSLDFSVTKKKNSIPQDMISDPDNTIPLVLAHNGNFGCSATLSIELGDNNNKKVANVYYYNSKTKELEFVDSNEIVNGKANLVFTHASDWAIVISDISAEYEDVSSAAGIYEADDNSQSPLYMIMIIIIIAAVGFSSIIILKRFAKKKH